MIKRIWNVSVKLGNAISGYQFEGNNITHVLKQAQHELAGEVIKIALADYDED